MSFGMTPTVRKCLNTLETLCSLVWEFPVWIPLLVLASPLMRSMSMYICQKWNVTDETSFRLYSVGCAAQNIDYNAILQFPFYTHWPELIQ